MRAFSSNILAMLASRNTSIFFLVDIYFVGNHIQHTNMPYDITVLGLGTYYADNTLKAVEAPKVSSVVDRAAYKIVYGDPNFEFRSIFENGVTGSTVEIRIGFLNNLDFTFGDAEPGMPLLLPEDIVLSYKGVIDTYGYNISGTDVIVTMECSSPMSALDLVKAYNASASTMKLLDATDTAYDAVQDGSSAVTLLWGKI